MKKKEIINELLNPNGFSIIAGPCTIENRESLDVIACSITSMGIKILRGGAYKMRTSPHSFRGLGELALSYLREVGEKYSLLTVSECIEVNHVELLDQYIDVILIGTRNMQNYPLLERLGKIKKPVILKRGMSATYEEWLLAAEYITQAGNPHVILCERGIRTFEPFTRNTLDLSSIPAIKSMSTFPVIIDPSHSTGKQELVKSMTWAATAAGANGVMIETHPSPEMSVCDAQQSVSLEQLREIVKPINDIRKAINQ